MKKIGVFLLVAISLFFAIPAHAADDEDHTFTQPFQNTTTTLSGRSVRATMYFTKIDYWDVKKAELNLNFQVSQLDKSETSDITVSLNGIKIESWRPETTEGKQTHTLTLPLDLIEDSNTLVVEGQLLNFDGNQAVSLVQTPANWLTIYDGSNVNFQYNLEEPDDTIHSFYNHFVGADTIANQDSAVLVSDSASEEEMSAASYGLLGFSRIITTSEEYLPLDYWGNETQMAKDYKVLVGLYGKLPNKYQAQVDESRLNDEAVIKYVRDGDQNVLIVTSKNSERLIDAGRYISNQELMTQTDKKEKWITANTQTFTSSLEFSGTVPITSTDDQLTGALHQEQVYFITMPTDRNNLDGSSIDLKIKYAENLDFDTSLVSVSVNDQNIGSQKLTKAKANGDTVSLDFPDGIAVSGPFTLKISFDLNVKDNSALTNGQTPWAQVENTSEVTLRTKESDDLLFDNYPNLLIKNEAVENVGIVLPTKVTEKYMQSLTNILNLLGVYTQSNTGDINYYFEEPNRSEKAESNLFILGTPEDNSMIKDLNDELYFQYNKNFTTFLSNEKLSIESDYGKTIGTAQLLRSPYNQDAAAIVLTGTTPESVYLASTQLKSEANASVYSGDTVVVDQNYKRYDYRFKKVASAAKNKTVTQKVLSSRQLTIYLVIFALALIGLGLSIYFILNKYRVTDKKKGSDSNE